jgi:2-polyprenyl-6-methoxyphenol hydroxylase-like FAD-dependent oxidoreductase
MDDRVDLVVLGGGPAGAAAAITARRAGLRVALIERCGPRRSRPGETLHPGIEPLLRSLGVWARIEGAGYLRHAGIWSEGSGPRRFMPYGSDNAGPWLGLQAPRDEFDARLLDAAKDLGVDVRFGVSATSCVFRRDPATRSDATRPLIPTAPGHRFR